MSLNLVKENRNSFEFLRQEPHNTIIFTDIDGTLSEIAATPKDASISDRMKTALIELAGIYQVVVVSGRPALEAKNMIADSRIIYLGNHGLERLTDNELIEMGSLQDLQTVKKIKEAIEHLSEEIEGVRLEDKRSSLAIHYRLAADPEIALQKILSAINSLVSQEGFQILKGRKVVELKPRRSNKGDAIAAIIGDSHRRQVIYLGDDRTDVDAFRKLKELRKTGSVKGYTLGVISDETPQEILMEADFCFNSVPEVEEFLEWLAD